MTPQRIIFHHSAFVQSTSQRDSINEWHKKRDFPISSIGWYIGYHYLIDASGNVFKAREENEIGAHDSGENANSLGICLEGDFTKSLPTESQCVAIANLVADINTRWHIPITHFEPHRWDDTTECPGAMLPDNWLVEQYLTRLPSNVGKAFWYLGKHFGWL